MLLELAGEGLEHVLDALAADENRLVHDRLEKEKKWDRNTEMVKHVAVKP